MMRIIAGEARGRIIEAPAGRHTRPTLDRIRENMFNMLQPVIPGSRILDLFAGSGALSLEALSRGAEYAVLVDSDRNAAAVQKKNIEALRYAGKTRQMHCDWHAAADTLKREKEVFDLIFLDPPYAMQDLRDVFSALVTLTGPDTIIVLEHEAGKEIQVSDDFEKYRDRAWGFCAVSMYRHKLRGE